jgi:putative ABC transport system permease protein
MKWRPPGFTGWGRNRAERELDAELRDHVERQVAALVRDGVAEGEARRRARLEFGGIDQIKDACRDVRRGEWFADFLRDCRYGVRLFLRRPIPAITIVVTLAAALGLNTSIFAVAGATILHPFSFADVDRLVLVSEIPADDPGAALGVSLTSAANLEDWRRREGTIDSLVAMTLRDVELTGDPEPQRLSAAFVSPRFFDVLGVRPQVGRTFVDSEERPGNHRRVILSDGLWQRTFGSDRGVIGRTVVLDGELFQIVGVAPPHMDFPFGTELWAPLPRDSASLAQRDDRSLAVIGRLADGVSLAAAQADMTTIGDDLARRYPDSNGGRRVHVATLSSGLTEQGIKRLFVFVQASALFVLLIACVNVVNLLFALGADRQHDQAVRLALGASRGRLVRATLAEGVLLAMAAVPLALAVAAVALGGFKAMMPARLALAVPGWQSIAIDRASVAFVTILALGAAFLFSAAPAVQTSDRESNDLKEAARMTAGPGRQRLRAVLVAAQVALVLPLLAGAALAWRGTVAFLNGPQGFDPKNVLAVGLTLPERSFADESSAEHFVDDALREISSAPGIRGTAVANNLPSTGLNTTVRVAIDGGALDNDRDNRVVDLRIVSPTFFDVMSIRLRDGRPFFELDRDDAQPVAIVSASMANRFWPGRSPLGQQVRDDAPGAPWLTIVGVVDDVIQDWFWGRNVPTLYRPFAQQPVRDFAVAVRTVGTPASATPVVAAAIHRIDPSRPLLDVRSMEQIIRERLAAPLQVATMMAVLGVLALTLAAVGLYGVIAYLVSQRTHEIGLRLALGAAGRDIFTLIFTETATTVAIGIAVGAVLAILSGKLLGTLLEGIVWVDVTFLVTSISIVAGVAAAAAYIPARRALSIDPAIALRSE